MIHRNRSGETRSRVPAPSDDRPQLRTSGRLMVTIARFSSTSKLTRLMWLTPTSTAPACILRRDPRRPLRRRIEGGLLARIAEQIADHAHIVGIGKLDHQRDVWARVPQRGMNRIPDAHPTVDAPAPRHAMPSEVVAVASIANPFGAELKSSACVAALDGQMMLLDRIPEAADPFRCVRLRGRAIRPADNISL